MLDILPESTLNAVNALEQEQASEPNRVVSFKFFLGLRFQDQFANFNCSLQVQDT